MVVLLCVRRDAGQQCPFDGGEEAQAIFEYVGCDPEFVGGFVLVVRPAECVDEVVPVDESVRGDAADLRL